MQACLSLNFKLKRLLPCEPDACIRNSRITDPELV